jgi:hypothetical protein
MVLDLQNCQLDKQTDISSSQAGKIASCEWAAILKAD